ncbi:enoyl-CoA hydratase/isomerase family protein [Thalassococcus sp. CAU 1522]|uniref:Enoyl-CoA hydratase/isomerase family protein n=1 Tax=Thalassococcus arenae TaxID=2851652 RepID=A0ABS6NC15_9RHOB|nr:FAD-dependent oxidoreductase [Thalassococcus arenae]MBV2361518.1 enoyl-CoA hydratase/isomerase family protein [Thalassococcus arenae]
MSVTKHRDKDIGFVEIDNPPVNAIGQAVRQGLLDAVRWAEQERLTRVILTGHGRAFAAGADAREFDGAPIEPHLPDVLNAIETSDVPWVAAINGVALGGGAEIAMACRMRIIAPGAQIGLPEVTLGVIPGAGGTVRLPRLVGLSDALEIITTGKPLVAADALRTGLVHAVEDDPVDAALAIPGETLACIVPTRELPAPKTDISLIAAAREKVAAKSRGQVAALRAIDVIEHGLDKPFGQALSMERAVFLELRSGEQARALRHVFFAERAAKAPDWLRSDPAEIARVAVVGGGTMGAGIAYALSNAGLTVTLVETDAEGAARATDNVARIIETSLGRGLIDRAGADDRRRRIGVTDDYSAAGGARLAIEAAFESMDVKRAVFARLSEALPSDAILATNTSYLDIDEIAASLPDPTRVLGLHFFAPAHIMKLLEIVRGAKTSDAALATGFALAKRLRKVPVLAGVCDGFIGNRILSRYREAADTLLIDGSTPSAVDAAMVEFGYAMGPYEAQDLSGLEIAHANRRRQDATRDPQRRYVPIADRLVALGRLGKKTGAGWYRYSDTGTRIEDPIVTDIVLAEARSAGVSRTVFSAEDIRDRLVLAMINEACDILHEGIAQSAADIDLVTVFGYGFPRWRGGLLHHADTLGAAEIVRRLGALSLEDPVAWKISPVLLECANDNLELAKWTRAPR